MAWMIPWPSLIRILTLGILLGSLVPPPAVHSEPTKTQASKLVTAALERTKHKVRYDGSYVKISYPGGDVPKDIGVCTDLLIRSYRKLGVDLQVKVHEDMRDNFGLYPKKWRLSKPDTNIDHRRVPNLQVFFERKGQKLPITKKAKDYRPGDIVTWNVSRLWRFKREIPHIGIVVDRKVSGADRFLVVHNIGSGPKLEDVLFEFPITGHYRYLP